MQPVAQSAVPELPDKGLGQLDLPLQPRLRPLVTHPSKFPPVLGLGLGQDACLSCLPEITSQLDSRQGLATSQAEAPAPGAQGLLHQPSGKQLVIAWAGVCVGAARETTE